MRLRLMRQRGVSLPGVAGNGGLPGRRGVSGGRGGIVWGILRLFRRRYRFLAHFLLFWLIPFAKAKPGKKAPFFIFCHCVTPLLAGRTESVPKEKSRRLLSTLV
nr:hypothetical protein [Pantoea sp. 1.19]